MAALDNDALLAPVAGDHPCGPDLSAELAFGEFERSAMPIPERESAGKKIDAVEPDWRKVMAQGQAMLQTSKDLRIALPVLEAATRGRGLTGFAEGLDLVQRLLTDYWEGIHPVLDAEDNNDPTERVNCLLRLTDNERILGAVRTATLVSSKAAGKFSYRDWQIASGELQVPLTGDQQPPNAALIEAAFSSADIEALQASAGDLDAARVALAAIEKLLADKLATTQLPDFSGLAGALAGMIKLMATHLALRGVGEAPEEAGSAGGGPNRSAPGEIRSRDDVTRMLDRVCVYLEQNEPSSPVPLLLHRAKRLVAADYMTIIRDLTPDALSQAQDITGQKKE